MHALQRLLVSSDTHLSSLKYLAVRPVDLWLGPATPRQPNPRVESISTASAGRQSVVSDGPGSVKHGPDSHCPAIRGPQLRVRDKRRVPLLARPAVPLGVAYVASSVGMINRHPVRLKLPWENCRTNCNSHCWASQQWHPIRRTTAFAKPQTVPPSRVRDNRSGNTSG